MSIIPLKLGFILIRSNNASSEFFIKLIKTLFNCSASPLISDWLLSSLRFILFFKDILKNSTDLLIISITFIFLNIGLGILAKLENSFTKFSMSLICLLIVSKYFSKSILFFLICGEYFSLRRSIDNCIGVRGFFISWASFLATLSQASYLSVVRSLSCCFFNLSIMELKLLFNCLNSSSVSIFATFTSNAPLLIASDALIKLIIGLVNLDANVIAIDVDKNNNNVTTII